MFLGEVEEVADAFRLLDTHNWRYLGEDRTGTPGRSASPAVGQVGVAARGGSGKDKFQRRVDEWSQRFFREAGTILQQQMLERGMERLILLGVPEEAKPLLPGPVAEKVGAILPALHTPVPSAAEVLKAVSEVIERVERSEEEALLEQVRQKGVGGLEQVLSLLQEGRLQYVLVPWHLQEKAWRCADGWVGSSPQAAQAHSPGRPVEEVELKQVLTELAARYGTELEFVHGAVEERLRRELGGSGRHGAMVIRGDGLRLLGQCRPRPNRGLSGLHPGVVRRADAAGLGEVVNDVIQELHPGPSSPQNPASKPGWPGRRCRCGTSPERLPPPPQKS